MRNGTTLYGGVNNYIQWNPVALWGGGFVTQVDKVGDTLVIRTDTAGSWIWDTVALEWKRLIRLGDNVTQANGKYNYLGGANGCYDVAIAPSDANTIYVIEMGWVYKTDDLGVTVTRTNFPNMTALDPNDNSRTCRKKLVVDSASASVVAFFDPTVTTGGLRYSLDGGTTVAKSASVPATATGTGGCVAYDRDSTVTSSKHQYWGVWVPGDGLYLSTTGPNGTFTKDAGYPGGTTDVTSLIMFGNGVIMTCDGANIYRRTAAGVWSTRSTEDLVCFALNYADTTKVLGVLAGGALLASTDSGVTWTTDPNSAPPRVAADAPWLATTKEDYMSAGGLVFDPAVAGRVWFTEGIGVWYTDSVSYTQGVVPTWHSRNKGLRGLVTQRVNMTASGDLLITCQDRNTARFSAGAYDVCPGQVGFNNATSIVHGNDRECALDDEDYQVLSVYAASPIKIATDGGGTATSWTAAAAGPDGDNALGGNVAIGNAGNIVVLPAGNYPPIYSTNGGSSWAYCQFGGVTLPAVNGNGGTANGLKPFNSLYFRRKVLVRDPNNAGHFWFYCCGTDDVAGSGPTYDTNYAGLWRSTNSGASFTRVYAGHLDASFRDFYHSHIVPVPGRAGHLFWYCGDVSVDDVAANVLIKFSDDYGATWTDVPGIYECEAMCVGEAAPGRSYPSLTAYGYTAVANATALTFARCDDFNPANPAAATWYDIGPGPFPEGDYCSGVTLTSHPSQPYGLVVAGKAGAGAMYGQYDHTVHGT